MSNPELQKVPIGPKGISRNQLMTLFGHYDHTVFKRPGNHEYPFIDVSTAKKQTEDNAAPHLYIRVGSPFKKLEPGIEDSLEDYLNAATQPKSAHLELTLGKVPRGKTRATILRTCADAVLRLSESAASIQHQEEPSVTLISSEYGESLKTAHRHIWGLNNPTAPPMAERFIKNRDFVFGGENKYPLLGLNVDIGYTNINIELCEPPSRVEIGQVTFDPDGIQEMALSLPVYPEILATADRERVDMSLGFATTAAALAFKLSDMVRPSNK